METRSRRAGMAKSTRSRTSNLKKSVPQVQPSRQISASSRERKRLKISVASKDSLRQNVLKGGPEATSQFAIAPSASTTLRRESSSASIPQKYLENQAIDPSTEHDSESTDASTSTGGNQRNTRSSNNRRARLKRKRDDSEDNGSLAEYRNITHGLEMRSVEMELKDKRRSLERREQQLDEKQKRLESLEDNLFEMQAKLIQAEEETISEAERTLTRLEEDFSCSLAYPLILSQPKCGHTFCAICILKWFFSHLHDCGQWHETLECPICRTQLPSTSDSLPRSMKTCPFTPNRLADSFITDLVNSLASSSDNPSTGSKGKGKHKGQINTGTDLSTWAEGGSSREDWLQRMKRGRDETQKLINKWRSLDAHNFDTIRKRLMT